MIRKDKLILPTLVAMVLFALFMLQVPIGSAAPEPVMAAALPPAQAADLVSVAAAPENAAQPASISGDCQVSDRYPDQIRQWCDLITQHAAEHGLDPDLLAALIWQESNGNPQAYSKSGAVGLMQVMPRDGIAAGFMCKNGPCFHDRPDTASLQDPEFNIKYGSRMLAQLVSKQGNLREGLRAYGPMNVGYYYADKVLGIFQNYGQ